MRALEDVLASGLLVEDGDAIGFRHLLAAQAVYEAMPGPRRRELHARAAAALAAIRPPPHGQLAHHLRHAGRLDAWVTAAERAADQAAGLGHDDEVVRLLEQVLRNAPLDHEQRGRIALKLARAAVETLHAQDVLDPLLAVPTELLPARTRSELRFWLSLLLNQTGDDPVRQRRLTEEAVAELDHRPDLKAWAMVGLALASRSALRTYRWPSTCGGCGARWSCWVRSRTRRWRCCCWARWRGCSSPWATTPGGG